MLKRLILHCIFLSCYFHVVYIAPIRTTRAQNHKYTKITNKIKMCGLLYCCISRNNSVPAEDSNDDNDGQDNHRLFQLSECNTNNDEEGCVNLRTVSSCAWCSALLRIPSSPEERVIRFGSHKRKVRLCDDVCWRKWILTYPGKNE